MDGRDSGRSVILNAMEFAKSWTRVLKFMTLSIVFSYHAGHICVMMPSVITLLLQYSMMGLVPCALPLAPE